MNTMELTVLLMPFVSSILVLELAAGYPSRAATEVNKQDSYIDHLGARVRRETPGDMSQGEIIQSGTDGQDSSLANSTDPNQQDTNTEAGYQDSNLDPPPGDSGSDPALTERPGNLQDKAIDTLTETGSPGTGEGTVDPVYDGPVDTHTDTHTEVITDTVSDTPADPTPEPKNAETLQSQPMQRQPMYNPLIMSRPGEGAPLALPMHQGKPHTAGENTGEHIPADSQPQPETAGSPSTPKPINPQRRQIPYDPRYPHDPRYQLPVPIQFQQGPVAMRQVGKSPSDSGPTQSTPEGSTPGRQVWGRQFRQPNVPQQQFRPMALPQRQGPPKGQKQGGNRNQGGKNQRAPPKWSGGGANKPPAGQAPAKTSAGGPAPSQNPSVPGMPPHPMFDYRFYDPYYYMYGPGAQGNQGTQNAEGGGTNPSAPPYPYPPYPPYPPYKMGDMPDNFMNPAYNMAIQQMGSMGGQFPGGQFPGPYPCTNMSDPMCMQMMQHRMMGGEMDMEGPFGEMDMEGPYELDIEGPMAFAMLRNMGMGKNVTGSHFPEITLNTHVLEAMQKRFGVNTTAGIQRMSSNPEFQAFMYQVLTHSAPVSLAEFNANLTKATVNEIIRNLDSGAANQRIPAGNLNHAHLNTQGSSSNGASLTLDNHPATGFLPPFGGVPPFGPFPGNTAPLVQNPGMPVGAQPGSFQPLVQNPGMPVGAQPGSFQPLVQQPMGQGGEVQEKPEVKKKATVATSKPTVSKMTESHGHAVAEKLVATHAATHQYTTVNKAATTTRNQPIQPTLQSQTIQSQPVPIQTDQSKTIVATAGPSPAQNQPIQQPAQTKEQDIVGKVSNQGLSKDQQTREEKMANAQNTVNTPQTANTQKAANIPANTANTQKAANIPANTANTQNAANTPVNTANNQNAVNSQNTAGSNAQPGAIDSTINTGQTPIGTAVNTATWNRDNMPIGLQEAGVLPDVKNNSVPIKAESGYTSTGFAIAAGTIIALIIIFGPIGCMLWKMKEKRDERLRKKKAYKNRDMSENSIMESMIMNDFGKGGLNSVTNEAAKPYDYFQYGKERYSMINTEIGEMDKLSGNPQLQRGRLP